MHSWGRAQHLVHMIHPIFSSCFLDKERCSILLWEGIVGQGPCVSLVATLCLCVITSKCAAQGQAVDASEGEALGTKGPNLGMKGCDAHQLRDMMAGVQVCRCTSVQVSVYGWVCGCERQKDPGKVTGDSVSKLGD